VAAAMGWQLRDYGYCVARASGVDAVNTTMKAVAICNHRTQAVNVTLCVEAELDRIEPGKPDMAVQMTIHEVDSQRPTKMRPYRISGQGNSDNKLVQSLLRSIQTGDGVSMNCIGPSAVYRAVLAFVNIRLMLLPKIETVMVPLWESILDKNQTPLSLIRLDVWENHSDKV
jgi:stage V sporulation protein SpoVS